MAEVFAGFVSGFALALITTPLLALWLVRSRESVALVARVLPKGVPPMLVAVPAANAAFIFWTGAGIIVGLVLVAANDEAPKGALGSPNVLFTAIAAILAFIIFMPPAVALRSIRRPMVLSALLFVAGFGWLTPWLAEIASR